MCNISPCEAHFSPLPPPDYYCIVPKHEGPITDLEQTGEIVATFAMLITKWFNDRFQSLTHGSDAKANVNRADELLGLLRGACCDYWLKVARQL